MTIFKSIFISFSWLLISLLGGGLAIMLAAFGKSLTGIDAKVVITFCKTAIYEKNQLIFFANALLLSVLFDYKHEDYYDFLKQSVKARKLLSSFLFGISGLVFLVSVVVCMVFFVYEDKQLNTAELVLYETCQNWIFFFCAGLSFFTKTLLYHNQHLEQK
ncbi:MAG: hypothetical protein ACKVTZ_05075 [Bacteroidia bacterium]